MAREQAAAKAAAEAAAAAKTISSGAPTAKK
jgi:hypothetical protein